MNTTPNIEQESFTYLALGDSYTIGEAVAEEERWPVQLVSKLKSKGVSVESPRIIATTGWTTDELQGAINEAAIENKYDIVSLLIGVNNQYRGYPIAQYKKEFDQLLKQSIAFAGGEASNVFVLSIPDYGVTPFVKEREMDSEKIAKELDGYNNIAKSICAQYNVSFTDITQGSKKAKNDSELVAKDGLHPSGKMYKNWVDAVFDKVLVNLSSR